MYRSCIEGEFQNEATWKMEQESALVLVWLGSKQQFRIPRWESESWNHTAKAVMLCLLRLLRLDLNRRQPCQYPKSIAGGEKTFWTRCAERRRARTRSSRRRAPTSSRPRIGLLNGCYSYTLRGVSFAQRDRCTRFVGCSFWRRRCAKGTRSGVSLGLLEIFRRAKLKRIRYACYISGVFWSCEGEGGNVLQTSALSALPVGNVLQTLALSDYQ